MNYNTLGINLSKFFSLMTLSPVLIVAPLSTQSLAAPSFNNPFAAQIQAQVDALASRNPAKPQIRKMRADQCSNYAGTWEGRCTTNGQEEANPSTMVVTQYECKLLTINGEQFPIGGNATNSLSGPEGSIAAGVAYQIQSELQPYWDSDATHLLFQNSTTGHSISETISIRSFFNATSKWTLSDPQSLTTYDHGEGNIKIDGQDVPLKFVRQCEFRKQ